MSVEIHDLSSDDLEAVTRIHLRAFPFSALTFLGFEAVRRYYDWLLNGPHDAATYGVFRDDLLLGFCFCGKFNGALSGFVKKNKQFLVMRVILRPWLWFTREFRRRIRIGLKALFRRPAAPTTNSESAAIQLSFGILAIAVSPKSQRTGAGKRLMEKAENIARKKGFEKMNLSSAEANLHAIVFYERLGWQRVMEDGTWKGRMTKTLSRKTADV